MSLPEQLQSTATAEDSRRLINLAHPQQDVHRVRQAVPGHSRYRFAERLLPRAGGGSRLLEVGGGMAEFSQRLRELGYQVTFTDLNPNSVAHAASLGFESHQIDFNLGLPGIDDKSFDVVVMLEVIEHIVNAEHLLSEVRRVLKPGGVLVLSTPNFAWWYNRLRILSGRLSHDEGYHYRFFTRQSLERQLRAAGLQPQAWQFSSPAYGVNRLRRKVWGKGRVSVLVPGSTGPLLGQTLFVRARAGR